MFQLTRVICVHYSGAFCFASYPKLLLNQYLHGKGINHTHDPNILNRWAKLLSHPSSNWAVNNRYLSDLFNLLLAQTADNNTQQRSTKTLYFTTIIWNFLKRGHSHPPDPFPSGRVYSHTCLSDIHSKLTQLYPSMQQRNGRRQIVVGNWPRSRLTKRRPRIISKMM